MVGFFGFLDLDFGPRNIVSRSGLRTCPGRRPTDGVLSTVGRAGVGSFWIGADHNRAAWGFPQTNWNNGTIITFQ
jgi:hypothetical protein